MIIIEAKLNHTQFMYIQYTNEGFFFKKKKKFIFSVYGVGVFRLCGLCICLCM